MEQRGFSQADLSRLFNSRSRSSEVLLGKRNLTISMIEKLSLEWGADANELVKR